MRSSGSFSLRGEDWWRETLTKFKASKPTSTPERGFALLKEKLAYLRREPLPMVPEPHWTTNSGYPYFRRAEYVQSEVNRDIEAILYSRSEREEMTHWPYMLGWRGQPKKFPDVTKSRVVWMEVKSWSAVTSMFTYPIIDALKQVPEFCQLAGPVAVDTTVFAGIMGRSKDRHFISGDKSSFDASISQEILFGAIDVVKSLLILTKEQEEIFDSCFSRFVNKSLLTPDGKFEVNSGVPSGHGATNLIDSIITLALIYEMVGETWCLAGGDDDTASYPLSVSAKDVSDFYSTFGITAHPEKQMVSQDVILFLNRMFGNVLADGAIQAGARSCVRAFNGIISTEHKMNLNRYDWTLRYWSQLQECEYSPVRNLLLNQVQKMDKYGLYLNSDAERREVLTKGDLRRVDFSSKDVMFRLSQKPIFSWWIFKR